MIRSFAGPKRRPFIAGNVLVANKNPQGLPRRLQFVRMSWLASLTAFLCFAVTIAFSQESASLSGTVKDSTGSSIPNAAVALTNNKTAKIKKTATGLTGSYSFTNLAAGDYTIQISAPGFATQQKPIPLAVGQEASLDLSLFVAEEVESVSVTGETDPYSVIPDQATSSVFGLPQKVEDIPRSVSNADSALLDLYSRQDGERSGHRSARFLHGRRTSAFLEACFCAGISRTTTFVDSGASRTGATIRPRSLHRITSRLLQDRPLRFTVRAEWADL